MRVLSILSNRLRRREPAARRSATTGRPRGRRWIARIVMAGVLAVALAYFPYRLLDGSGARKAAELRAQHEHTVSASRQLIEENAQLRREIDALERDSSALEDIARNEFGMVFPNELIIRIEGEP